jgi:hypothetical protein
VRSRKTPHHGKHNRKRQTTQTEPQPNQALTPIPLPLPSALLLSISPPQKAPPSPQRWPEKGSLPAAPAGPGTGPAGRRRVGRCPAYDHRDLQGVSSSPPYLLLLLLLLLLQEPKHRACRPASRRTMPASRGRRGDEAARLPPAPRAAYVAGPPAAPLTDAGELVRAPRMAAASAGPPPPCPHVRWPAPTPSPPISPVSGNTRATVRRIAACARLINLGLRFFALNSTIVPWHPLVLLSQPTCSFFRQSIRPSVRPSVR